MMKRTFFTLFLCVLLSFSVFTVDVYASSSSTYNCRVNVYSSGANTKNVAPVVSGIISSPDSVYYSYSLDLDFTDFLTLSFNNVDTGSRISEGTYSFFTVVEYSLEVSDLTYPSGSDYPVGVFNSVRLSFDSLPDGMLYHVGSHPPALSYNSARKVFTYDFSFWLYGTFFTPDSYGLTVSVPISFDIVMVSSFSKGSLAAFSPFKFTSDVSIADLYSVIPVTRVSSSPTTDAILGDVNDSINRVDDTIKQQHQEEIDKADQATSDVTDGVGQLTNTLSTWEIITMPFNLVKNFAQAIAGDGSSAFTFPSFSMMGYQIWPSYTFDLQTVASSFPVLYNGMHLVTGTVVVTGFVRYLWRKWSLLVGDDMPEGGDSS